MVSVQDLDPTAMDTTAMVSINNMYFRYLGAFMLGLSVQNLSNWHSQTAQHSNFEYLL